MVLRELRNGLKKCKELDPDLVDSTAVITEIEGEFFQNLGYSVTVHQEVEILMLTLRQIPRDYTGRLISFGMLLASIGRLSDELLDAPLYFDIPEREIFCDIQEIDICNVSGVLLLKIG